MGVETYLPGFWSVFKDPVTQGADLLKSTLKYKVKGFDRILQAFEKRNCLN
jgi:hypothetical protein